MSIIEKLGITPGPWERNECGGFKSEQKGLVPHSSCFVEDAYSPNYSETEESKANDFLIAAAPEMLDALVDIAYATYDFCMNPEGYPDQYINDGLDILEHEKRNSLNESDFPKLKSIIEKAAGKSWEEIKALID